MKHVMKFYKPYILTVIAAIALLFGQALMELKLPEYMAAIINGGILKGDMSYIYKTGLIMLVIAALMCLFAIGVGFLASRVSAKVGRDVRGALFRRVTAFSPAEMETFSTASLITRATNDVQQVQNATVMLIRMAFFAPVMGVGALYQALKTNFNLSWTIGLSLVAVLILLLVTFFTTMPKFKIVQTMIDKINLVVNERLSGNLVIRAFNTEKYEEQRFEKANKDYMNLNLFINKAMALLMPAMFLIMDLVSVLVVWVGAKYVSAGILQIGDVLAFIQYAMILIISFLFIAMMFIMVPRAVVSMNRIGEVLATHGTVTDPDSPKTFNQDVPAGTLEFKNVYFKYPDAKAYVLEDISFVARPGQTTAFIGSTGSGKSSLINLVPRFFDASQGQVLVDGTDVKEVTQKELRARIGYVPQKALLFSGTIGSNIAFSDESMSPEQIKKATQVAQALDFVNQKEEGFDDPIAQGGGNVSGGQKQRLSIARALAKNAEILVFDDSFSALDFTTDAALRKALKESYSDKTILIVAQRINTIIDADQIVVLDEGRIVGVGTHRELLASCPVYMEIASSQLDADKLEGGEIDG
ncbi:MAG TPA: ABC transporter ATP-binding protein [Anaerovoracaceae bacterium]|nr:ABC transporter ATP-binding protein [Anaerovoracaceae bacterium]